MFSKVLVANRGEIAVRVIRTCRELGITSVAVYSEPDSKSMHTRIADEAVLLPGDTSADTYLNIQAIVETALAAGVDAVHPGYGFLAENAEFARALQDAGLVFIGPPAGAIEVMGEKVAARAVAEKAEVPQVPGTKNAIDAVEDVLAFGRSHGYPIAIKASYGGGGPGMRTVASESEAAEALSSARREAAAAFGRDEVYLERYIENARHVEVQVFADTHGNVIWLGDRDCSIQRRHQKLLEEAPAPGLTSDMRAAMGDAAVRLAKAVDYVGAGTVEYLVEVDAGEFYFLEMNTRIQVEHPVTEATLGLDLIAEQLRVAMGDELSVAASGPTPRGHAIEIRINAEDVAGGAFRPSPGPVARLDVPVRAGVRFDGGYETGDEVLPYYDSLIGKLVVWAPTRAHAIDRARLALEDMVLDGVPTTIPAAAVILDHPDFRSASISTRWLENDSDIAEKLPPTAESAHAPDETDETLDDRQEVWIGGRQYLIPLPSAHSTGTAPTSAAPKARRPSRTRAGAASAKAHGASGSVTSPMQGTVVTVKVDEGDLVEAGQIVAVLEAMKMENPLRAGISGTVAAIHAKVGQVLSAGTVVLEITPES